MRVHSVILICPVIPAYAIMRVHSVILTYPVIPAYAGIHWFTCSGFRHVPE